MYRRLFFLVLVVCAFTYTDNYSHSAEIGPLLQKENLVYKGAFRVPAGNLGGESKRSNTLGFGGGCLTYNKTRNSLYISTYERLILELSIPKPIISNNISDLNTATLLQYPVDLTSGNYDNLKEDRTPITNGGVPGGFLLYNNKLVGSAYAYYDGAYQGTYSHFTASPNWIADGKQFKGLQKVGVNPINPTSVNGGFVGGYMCAIPQEWQATFGGPALTGKGAISVIGRSSTGPCAWVFNPDAIAENTTCPAKILLGYPSGHTTLGAYTDVSNLYYNRTAEYNGMVFPSGSSSILFFGRIGLGVTGEGDSCYGSNIADASKHYTFPNEQVVTSVTPNELKVAQLTFTIPSGLNILAGVGVTAKPTANLNYHVSGTVTSYSGTSLVINVAWDKVLGEGTGFYNNWQIHIAGTTGEGSVPYCYDLVYNTKGPHAYPYIYQAVAYDANDLAKVQNAITNPSTGQPYQPWDLKPYSRWVFDFPFANPNGRVLGVAYDSSTQTLFISQDSGDKNGLDPLPIIYVYQITIPSKPQVFISAPTNLTAPPLNK
ncbi:hypothetical protein [Desulforhabdus sp. TSK]|uniref:hypothetical protein n=1 Tax=Desulforhabdus sp. TSK TaxID=2925014 RepID=UPI001FC87CE4|nr:hypothetical protein [Desulforhabdus sp. TSK]GKT07859.1 hypothetical protein DSTSK_11640 [Desulforhabdus sp. TSK]